MDFEASSSEFRSILVARSPIALSDEQLSLLVKFRELVLRENETQNLTRLLSPTDFYEGHVEDVFHLQRSGYLRFPVLDLGSGMGSPGLIYALLFGGEWILCDSEAHKARFMLHAVQELGLASVQVTDQRAEKVLDTQSVGSIVSKAVGPLTRIYTWIGSCSTWNKLILLKGPKWSEEWKEFELKQGKKQPLTKVEYSYESGTEKRQRVLVCLSRVPRGTIQSR